MVENLIKIPQTPTNSTKYHFIDHDLSLLLADHYNEEAQAVMTQRITKDLVVQWNRKTSDKPFAGDEAYALGYILKKLKINHANDLCVSNYVRDYSTVDYYGWTVEESKVASAALSLVNMFNDVCAKGLVRAVLTPLLIFKLANGKHAIVSYFAVDQANKPLVQSIYSHCMFLEGSMPPEFP